VRRWNAPPSSPFPQSSQEHDGASLRGPQTQRWLHAGVFEALVHDLRELLRIAAGRAAQPTAAVLDSWTGGGRDHQIEGIPDVGQRPLHRRAEQLAHCPHRRCPHDASGRVGYEEAPPGEAVGAGEHSRQDALDREESVEEHHASSESLEKVFPNLQSRLDQADISAVAAEEGVSCPPADLIAQVGGSGAALLTSNSPRKNGTAGFGT
jgi:hypothetical protein